METGREALTAFIADGAESGEFDVPDVNVAAEFLLHALHGSVSSAMHAGSSADRTIAVIQQLARRTLGS